ILPFPNLVLTVEVRGDVLRQALSQSLANRGSGGFLQTTGVAQAEDGAWLVGGEPLDDARVYRVAVNGFLVSGRLRGRDVVDSELNPMVIDVERDRDERMALSAELRRLDGQGRSGARGGAVASRPTAPFSAAGGRPVCLARLAQVRSPPHRLDRLH